MHGIQCNSVYVPYHSVLHGSQSVVQEAPVVHKASPKVCDLSHFATMEITAYYNIIKIHILSEMIKAESKTKQ